MNRSISKLTGAAQFHSTKLLFLHNPRSLLSCNYTLLAIAYQLNNIAIRDVGLTIPLGNLTFITP
jgi:hypothetical protein